ncbi:hypothetical protein XACS582_14390001 [Xanthomonas citri pv. citri]|uniref:Uncharacterized protein n=1 Tax=Xanthomonas citri pv. citri TaxID=611301 RepID=A0A0U5FA18_XANCI|nr:hypothetical protein XAC908_1310003 [Xanthomonas citri pv. citri]CEE29689.1 hypothetical protein XAC3824_640001 [Xanthomonas citri pv. citri]CEE52353.1 hypothetical protein XAC71A_1490007 [Xanthomonas citri pv. citri]CEE58860.1 hypothetical protein XACS584_1960002 [Xanthomonas citri pv. citri]CEE61788.1 hypothetical protein XAC3608_1960002 [Xanthomonas citri pv. citri]
MTPPRTSRHKSLWNKHSLTGQNPAQKKTPLGGAFFRMSNRIKPRSAPRIEQTRHRDADR